VWGSPDDYGLHRLRALLLGWLSPRGLGGSDSASRFILRNGFYDWNDEVEASVAVEVIAGRYALAEDEALIIETPEPSVVHGGIQLGNLWVESIDYQTHQTSLNWFQSTPDEDGIIRYVLAHADPGVPNWLDISGHQDRGIFMRWQSPSEDEYPDKPTVKLVAFDDIRANLPEGHPTVTLEERAAVLQERYEAVNKRRNPTSQFDAQAQATGGSSGCAAGGQAQGQVEWGLALLMLAGVWRIRSRSRTR
jgi:MYXO-CTERM domain-containing protein